MAANRQQRSEAAEARNTDVNCVDSSFGEWPRADQNLVELVSLAVDGAIDPAIPFA